MNEQRRGRVLVVDDDAVILRIARDILTDEGFEVLVADSGATALAVLRSDPPALMPTDTPPPSPL